MDIITLTENQRQISSNESVTNPVILDKSTKTIKASIDGK